MDTTLVSVAGPGVLAVLLGLAVRQDVASHRIPNAIVAFGTAVALFLHTLLPAGIGFTSALAGLGIGLAAFLPLYLLRAMGAGDVKLMAMVGAFLGPLDAFVAVLFTLLAGGLLALGYAIKARVLGQLVYNLRVILYTALAGAKFDPRADSAARIPYSVAIACGTGAWLLWKVLA
jgi:prepilin peptidase CpaA